MDRKKHAAEMLPTPPMSSPELEVAQPLPSSSNSSLELRQDSTRTLSQPTRREPSIPVGSLVLNDRGSTPMRERKRRERPTLMDLLSSPQPSVSPERAMSPLSAPSLTVSTEVQRTSLSLQKDCSLPPSSPFSSLSCSPQKSVQLSPSPPSKPLSLGKGSILSKSQGSRSAKSVEDIRQCGYKAGSCGASKL